MTYVTLVGYSLKTYKMKSANWIYTLKIIKLIGLFIWALCFIADNFGWFESTEIMNSELLKTIKYLGILIYLLSYLFELKFVVKEKDIEISKLKTKLLNYEK